MTATAHSLHWSHLAGLLGALCLLPACDDACTDEPEVVSTAWVGFSTELDSPVTPLRMRTLERSRELDFGCRVQTGVVQVDDPTPRVTINGAPLTLVPDEQDPSAWWPIDGTWPQGELVLEGIEERTGPGWQIALPLTVLGDLERVDLDQADLAGRVFRLTHAADSFAMMPLFQPVDFGRLHLAFTDEDEPSAILFDIPQGASEGICTHPLTTKQDPEGGFTLLLPERHLSYALHEGDPQWEDAEPIIGPASFKLWASSDGMMGRGSGRLSTSAAAWSSTITAEQVPELLASFGVLTQRCEEGSQEECLTGSLWNLRFEEVELPVPDKACGDHLEAPPFICSVSTVPLGGGPLLIALLALRRSRRSHYNETIGSRV